MLTTIHIIHTNSHVLFCKHFKTHFFQVDFKNPTG